jgi:hypothetical protein
LQDTAGDPADLEINKLNLLESAVGNPLVRLGPCPPAILAEEEDGSERDRFGVKIPGQEELCPDWLDIREFQEYGTRLCFRTGESYGLKVLVRTLELDAGRLRAQRRNEDYQRGEPHGSMLFYSPSGIT